MLYKALYSRTALLDGSDGCNESMDCNTSLFGIGPTVSVSSREAAVPAGTSIHFVLLSGENVDPKVYGLPGTYFLVEASAVDTLSLAFTTVVSRRLGIPEDCLHFTWHKLTQNGFFEMFVTIMVRAIDEDLYNKLQDRPCGTMWKKMAAICLVCCGSCTDADEYEGRHLNCEECLPCFLCTRCRVYMPDASPRCLFCLDQSDVSYVLQTTREPVLRYKVLMPELVWSQ